jgi:hypothetical protein
MVNAFRTIDASSTLEVSFLSVEVAGDDVDADVDDEVEVDVEVDVEVFGSFPSGAIIRGRGFPVHTEDNAIPAAATALQQTIVKVIRPKS